MVRAVGGNTPLPSNSTLVYACPEAVKEIPFIIQVLLFLGVQVETPVEVFVDNVGAIFMSENASSSSRTRHMDTRWFYVNDLQSDKIVLIKFVRSEDNVADVATKNVSGETQDAHLERITAEKSYIE